MWVKVGGSGKVYREERELGEREMSKLVKGRSEMKIRETWKRERKKR